VTLPKPMTSGIEAKGRFGKQDLVYLSDEDVGQILAGMDPLEAAKYQILLLFLLGGGAGLGALMAVYVAAWRITDERDRLRLDRLAQR
jgi:ABC-type iron transport system FetAB permease component